jgi:pimeloyl-ACP methyl ester carboxylesterase
VVLGSRTRYWEYGDPLAPLAVVAVHGFRGDHHGLEAVVGYLCASRPDIRVLVPDLPGFGASEPLGGILHDVAGYGQWLRGFLDALGLLGTAVVLGHSFGTIVVSGALAAGLPAPRAVLINPIASPALSGPNAVGTRLAVFYYWLGARLPARLGFAVLRWRAVTRGMSITMAKTRDRPLRRWIHDQHDRYFGAFANRDVVLEAFRASVGADVSQFARDVTVPVLLVAADRDDITPVRDQHRLVALFPDARLRILSGVGHLIHYERPAEAAAEIDAFLAGSP